MNKLLGLSTIQSFHELKARISYLKIWKISVAFSHFRWSISRWKLEHISSGLSNSIHTFLKYWKTDSFDLHQVLRITWNLWLCQNNMKDHCYLLFDTNVESILKQPLTLNVSTRWLKGDFFNICILIASTSLLFSADGGDRLSERWREWRRSIQLFLARKRAYNAAGSDQANA
jgi:hypothetical protein